MMLKVKKTGYIILILIFIVTTLVSCRREENKQDKNNENTNNDLQESNDQENNNAGENNTSNNGNEGSDDLGNIGSLEGSIRLAGSTSMEKLIEALSEAFMNKYPKVTVSTEATGSEKGIEMMLLGSVDIGNVSRRLSESEKNQGAVENIIAIDGIAIITDKENSVKNLTIDQLVKIFTGEIKNWSAVGGKDQAIVVIGREKGSGTRDTLEETLGIGGKSQYSYELNGTEEVIEKVASTSGAIGYVAGNSMDDTILTMTIEDVELTVENMKQGFYLLIRPMVMVTDKDVPLKGDLIQGFFTFIKSEEGQEIINRLGMIPAE